MSDKVKLAVIGSGNIMGVHLDQGLGSFPDVDFAAWCDLNEANAQARNKQAGGKGQVFTDAEKMLDTVKPDAVYIAIPPFAHGPMERLVVERNIPFFIEKPIAIELDQAREIHEAVQAKNLITAVGYMTRYRTGVRRAREILQTQKPVLMHGGWLNSGVPESAPLFKWWVQKSQSGGQFAEQATHTTDLVRFLFGEITEVYATAVTGRLERPDFFTIEDAMMVQMKCANGATVSLHSSCAINVGGEIGLTFWGTDMKASFTDWEHHAVIELAGETITIPGEENIFAKEDRAFIDAVKTGDRSSILATYEDGYKAVRIAAAADESVKTGKAVQLD